MQRSVADIGVESIGLAHQRGGPKFDVSVDFIGYPVTFCYRHYLELSLKQLILTAEDLLDEPGKLPFRSHNLKNLWVRLRPSLDRVSVGEPYTSTVKHQIGQFADMDPGSDSFRFPVGRDGEVLLPGLRSFNLLNMKEIVDGLATWLDSVGA